MANAPKAAGLNIDNVQKALEKQIAELRGEIGKINNTIEERGARLAREAIETASARASRAAKRLGTPTQSMQEVARVSPGTVTLVIGAAALLGFTIGVAAGMTVNSQGRRSYWN
ncbi:hypothetical protein [Pseudaminobacter soli (ex Li et al. 2025)]|uniref:Uncharacterized protein n=1 Tax=Pseudaminobacter soli (ex Li et al. 2025) TaxID=1295366 RepID=A0A2P7S1C2_9HYPH|nr:hypothetical protein [Mesorhizobium soli]PSJ56275.1 hypothetical protein C7I85_25255 [Mesorhizobium soli]